MLYTYADVHTRVRTHTHTHTHVRARGQVFRHTDIYTYLGMPHAAYLICKIEDNNCHHLRQCFCLFPNTYNNFYMQVYMIMATQ